MIAMTARASLCLLVVALLALPGCGGDKPNTAAASKTTLVLSQVRVDRALIVPEKGEAATVRFHLNETAGVTLSIFDGRDRHRHGRRFSICRRPFNALGFRRRRAL